jgi:hypothetical protein
MITAINMPKIETNLFVGSPAENMDIAEGYAAS